MFGFKPTENVETAAIRQGDIQDNRIAGSLYVFL
jgi:hypothetical protein